MPRGRSRARFGSLAVQANGASHLDGVKGDLASTINLGAGNLVANIDASARHLPRVAGNLFSGLLLWGLKVVELGLFLTDVDNCILVNGPHQQVAALETQTTEKGADVALHVLDDFWAPGWADKRNLTINLVWVYQYQYAGCHHGSWPHRTEDGQHLPNPPFPFSRGLPSNSTVEVWHHCGRLRCDGGGYWMVC